MQYGHSRKGNNMIKINHLTITQNKDLRDLVSDLNINIQDGEKVAIIGEEGNGKSTLLRTLMGERLADFTIKGEIQSDLQSLAYIPQPNDRGYCSPNQQILKRSSLVKIFSSVLQGDVEECRPGTEGQTGFLP